MKNYFNLWTYKRGIQLGAGVYFFWEYNNHPSMFALILGSIMTFQAVANVGCFSSKGCTPNLSQNKKVDFDENKTIDYEEIE